MFNPYLIDASQVFPLTGDWREVDQRPASNLVSTWTERLCVSKTDDGYALAMCIFGALGEELFPEDDDAEQSLPPEYLPAFYEGELVSVSEDGFICGPLLVWGDGRVVEFSRPDEKIIQDALRQLDWSHSGELVERITELSQVTTSESELPSGLVDAYLSTSYQAKVYGGSFVLQVGSPSQKLLALYSDYQTKTAAFITAENPLGSRLSDEENRRRVNALLADGNILDLPCFEGEGVGEDASWAPERSALLLGLTFEQAVHLGRHHEQNAIIWAGEDALPKLVILR